jgi:hypothetical protein
MKLRLTMPTKPKIMRGRYSMTLGSVKLHCSKTYSAHIARGTRLRGLSGMVLSGALFAKSTSQKVLRKKYFAKSTSQKVLRKKYFAKEVLHKRILLEKVSMEKISGR